MLLGGAEMPVSVLITVVVELVVGDEVSDVVVPDELNDVGGKVRLPPPPALSLLVQVTER